VSANEFQHRVGQDVNSVDQLSSVVILGLAVALRSRVDRRRGTSPRNAGWLPSTGRPTMVDASQIREHATVVGSDGGHVGTRSTRLRSRLRRSGIEPSPAPPVGVRDFNGGRLCQRMSSNTASVRT
jgi:hypothetical protein